MKFMRKNGGFTLVELIVVIAILAILAGVAVPAYSGYIKKANEAADNQLVAAVNTAFAAACIENNIAPASVTSAAISVTNQTIGTVTSVNGAKNDSVAASFTTYFNGGASATFKVFTALTFNPNTHNFEGGTGMKVAYGGGFIYLNENDLAALKGASFLTALGGIDGVLDKVDNVASLATPIVGGMLDQLLGDEKFMNHAAEAMGLNRGDYATDEDFQNALFDKAMELGGKMEGVEPEEAVKKVVANAIVIHAAQNASQAGSKDGYMDLLQSENAAQTIKNNIANGDVGEAYSQAAVAYGMITAYAHATNQPNLTEGDDLINVVTTTLNDPNFRDWMKTDQAKTDMDGYLAAMNMVNNSSKDKDAVSSLLVNGFNDDELKKVFGDVLGE